MQINNTKSELIQELETRSNFFSIASQELRNPLAGLMLQSEMIARRLENDQRDVCIDKMRKALGHFHSDIHRLSRLVEEMTDLSEICKKKFSLHFDHFHLGTFVNELMLRLRPKFSDFNQLVTTEIQGDIIVYWDRQRIEQIFTNIIAHSFSFGSTPIKIRITHDQEKVIIVISDQGPNLVEDFTRQHGFGMGLFICQEIVQLHHGHMKLKSTQNYGSNFTITLPAIH